MPTPPETVIPIKKILIANRGEIASRIMRTCREMDIESVAVFSDVDRTAPHVRMADEAYAIGAAPSSASYLNVEILIETALRADADAVHPGYGFLAENAEFARACEKAGIRFIGPTPASIEAMGDKTAARALMERAGVPMAPGTVSAVATFEDASGAADGIGYPVLIKPAAGGGGKGMRIVDGPDALRSAFEAAGREAEKAFGDGRLFLEKYITEPRHIEFQILADAHGNTVHLFERECSIQRRHQKVIEEAPSPIMTDDLRARMGNAAVDAARSCDYIGAGTIEFLVDAERNFYFMEMNTRLQVEHAVTEWVTGLDLVREQIRIAEGHPLPFEQNEVSLSGHSIECRVYAEDPASNFLPAPGRLTRHRAPAGLGVRVDAGVEDGDDVSVHYDPMISKVTTWGATRHEAITRMRRSLREYEIAGVPTTISFCLFVLEHDAFNEGTISTHFVDKYYNGPQSNGHDVLLQEALARSAAVIWAEQSPRMNGDTGEASGQEVSRWRINRARSRRTDSR